MIVVTIAFSLIVAFIVFKLYSEWYSQKNKHSRLQPPGPLLTLWNKFQIQMHFTREGVPVAASYYLTKYGNVSRIYLCGAPCLLVSNPQVIEHVLLKNPKNYTIRFGNSEGLKSIGMHNKGIIWNREVSRWRVQREFFHRGVKSKMLENAVPITIELCDEFLKRNAPNFKDQKTSVDLLNELRRITLGVTLRLMFGVQNAPFDEMDVINAIVEYFKAWEYFLIRPSWTYYFSLSTKASHIRAVQRLNDYVDKLIEHSIDVNNDGETFFGSIYDAYQAKSISKEELHQSCLEMLLAGTDTSSVSLYYIFIALCEHSGICNRVVQEIDSLFPDSQTMEFSKLSSLTFMDSVINETMRMKPVGPVILRKALDQDQFNGIQIAKGTNMILNLQVMNLDPQVFQNPNQFDPDRFLLNDYSSKFYPFGAGPKGCVGSNLAKVEMKVVLSKILSSVRFNTNQTLENISTHWDIANQPVNPGIVECCRR